MTTTADWRSIDGVATAWFDTASLVEGAALAGRVVDLAPTSLVDVRATGLRVRLDSEAYAESVSASARGLGLGANPANLQQLGLVLRSTHPTDVGRFWQAVLDYETRLDGSLADPLRRDPSIRIEESAVDRPLRDRIHLDVVRPAASVEALGLGAGSGRFGVCHADADGNEVDLVPGDPLGDGPKTTDWQTVFGTMACYHTETPAQQRDLADAAARLADDAGFPLLIDLRPGLVVLDSGKDQLDDDAHGLDVDVTDLAARLQAAARELGATADSRLPRFVQFFLDAADVDAVSQFWLETLGYVRDRRDGVSDIHDPRRLGPVLVFQQIDLSETERRGQQGRIRLELAVPADRARSRVDRAVAAGGRLLEDSTDRQRVTDPEGNEVVVVSGK